MKKTVSLLLIAILVLSIICGCGNKSNTVESSPEETIESTETKSETASTTKETTEETTEVVADPINFVLFGIDTYGYTPEDIYKSDIIMVVSIDPGHKDIRFISLLRDTRAPIEGHSPQKINAAYQYGGAELALKTVNDCFGTDFTDYVTLDFAQMAILVDEIGGIDVQISAKEAELINSCSVVDIVQDGRNQYCVDVGEGLQHLDGTQALMYSRIRRLDSDYYRALRQHRALRAIIDKIKTLPITKYPALIKTFVDTVEETSFSVEDIIPWTTLGLDKYDISGYVIPDPDYEENLWGGIDDDNGQWVWVYDFEAAGDRLKKIMNREFNND